MWIGVPTTLPDIIASGLHCTQHSTLPCPALTRPERRGKGANEAEVRDLAAVLLVEEDVLELDVPVDEPFQSPFIHAQGKGQEGGKEEGHPVSGGSACPR